MSTQHEELFRNSIFLFTLLESWSESCVCLLVSMHSSIKLSDAISSGGLAMARRNSDGKTSPVVLVMAVLLHACLCPEVLHNHALTLHVKTKYPSCCICSENFAGARSLFRDPGREGHGQWISITMMQ